MIRIICLVLLAVVCAAIGFYLVLGSVIGLYASYAPADVLRFFPPPADEVAERHEEDLKRAAGKLSEEVTQEYTITARDGVSLQGYLVEAPEPSDVYVLYFHGYHSPFVAFECGQTQELWREKGYNLFTCDLRGHGKSEGKWLSFGEYESEDGLDWIRFLRRAFGENIRIILHGQSMGCATVLLMSGRRDLPDNVKMILADCGYTEAFQEAIHMAHISRVFAVPLVRSADLALRVFANVHLNRVRPVDAVKRARVPILFIHGGADLVVPCKMGRQNFEACGSALKEFHLFPGAPHAKSYAYYPEEYREVLYNFLEQIPFV